MESWDKKMKERKRKILELFASIVILTLFFGYPTYFFVLNYSPDTKHETNRWAIFEDTDGDKIALEVDDDNIWDEIQENWKEVRKITDPELHMYISGVVVSYDNSWGFRLDPSTVSSTLLQIDLWSKSRSTIEHIATYLNGTLSNDYDIHITTIRFYNSEYVGVIPFIIDLIVTGVSLLLFSLYFYFKWERKLSETIKDELLNTKETPKGITFTTLSQKTDMKQQRIKHLMNKYNLKDDLGLQINEDQIQFRELIYSKSISKIDEQLAIINQLSHDQLTLEHFSKLSKFKNDLEAALAFFKNSFNIEKQIQIETKIKVITDLLDSITLEVINKTG